MNANEWNDMAQDPETKGDIKSFDDTMNAQGESWQPAFTDTPHIRTMTKSRLLEFRVTIKSAPKCSQCRKRMIVQEAVQFLTWQSNAAEDNPFVDRGPWELERIPDLPPRK